MRREKGALPEPKKLAEVGSVQLLALRQIAVTGV
jgi:hypothetical protein